MAENYSGHIERTWDIIAGKEERPINILSRMDTRKANEAVRQLEKGRDDLMYSLGTAALVSATLSASEAAAVAAAKGIVLGTGVSLALVGGVYIAYRGTQIVGRWLEGRAEVETKEMEKSGAKAFAEAATRGECDGGCDVGGILKDVWEDTKYKYKVATAIREEFDYASRREELTNAPIDEEVAKKNEMDKEFHRKAHEKRIRGESVVEGKTRTFLRKNDYDGRLCKHTWTLGSLTTKNGHTYDGVYEYTTDDRGVVIHEFFNKKSCREKIDETFAR